jgi:hypothetical protein
MPTPGFPSGTTDFGLTNAGVINEAFDRIQIRPTSITRHHMISARQSMNLEMVRWSNLGINLWKMTGGTIDLAVGQELYALPASTVALTELWYSTPDQTTPITSYLRDGYGNLILDGNGQPIVLTGSDPASGANSTTDRIMVPITRQQYAMIPNKYQAGIPTQYWFERLTQPQFTIWQVPATGAPTNVLRWYGLERINDIGIAGGETPNVVNRALDALCACLAFRLAMKFSDKETVAARRADRDEAWAEFTANDTEPGPMIITPNVSAYGRMG